MKGFRLPLVGVVALVATAAFIVVTPAQRSDAAACSSFPADNYWHADVRGLPVHALSAQWMSHMSSGRNLHPDFGPSGNADPDYGIPITYVSSGHPTVNVSFDYDDESDHVGYPLGDDTLIEGGPNAGGDRHAIMVDPTGCRLYETYDTHGSGSRWSAGSGATWSLAANDLRPDGWTSADAAGLPILPGLLRWDEVRAGSVDHAIRFTTNETSRFHVWPARHDAGSQSSLGYPPMGARFRLKSGLSEAGYSAYARTVIAAMKAYGLVLADNGSPWYFQGEQNAGWPNSLIDELKRIPASAFEAVDTARFPHTPDSAAVGAGGLLPASPTCGGFPATMIGTEGPDRLVGTAGTDVIVGLGGNDRIVGKGEDDLLCGGSGKDVLKGGHGKHDKCIGGTGADKAKGCEAARGI